MQDKDLIPTPLIERSERPQVQIAASIRPGPFRVLRILAFTLNVAWLWWRTSFALRFTGRATTRVTMARLRLFLEQMGGLWIKAGQVVAMRRDLFLRETCDELSKLQDQAQGFEWALVRKIVEDDLGGPLETFFSEFSEHPIAAASIGQTHEARLRHNGVRVAVKVQRPFVAQSFERDLRYLRFVAACLNWFSIAPQARWDEMLWELEKALGEELDYRMEASAIVRMKKTLRKHKVYAPKVFFRFCSQRVLVMEFVDGVFMSDYIKVAGSDPARLQHWLDENGIHPDVVGKRLILSHVRQMFEDNLYHGDLHPGNIVLLRNDRFALIDFGTIGTFDKSVLQKYRMMFGALADGNFMKVAEMFLLLCPPLPNKDMTELKTDIVRALRVWESRTGIKRLPYHEKSLTSLFGVFAQLLRKYSVPSNWEFLRLNRSDLTMDASLMFLTPGINYLKLYRKYERQVQARSLRAATSGKAFGRAIHDLVMAGQVPAMLAENLYFEGEWVRKRALGFQGKISKVAYIAKGALSLFAVAALGSSLLFLGKYARQHFPARLEFLETTWLGRVFEVLPSYRPEVWMAVGLVAFYLSRKLVNLRHYVEEKDYDRPGKSS